MGLLDNVLGFFGFGSGSDEEESGLMQQGMQGQQDAELAEEWQQELMRTDMQQEEMVQQADMMQQDMERLMDPYEMPGTDIVVDESYHGIDHGDLALMEDMTTDSGLDDGMDNSWDTGCGSGFDDSFEDSWDTGCDDSWDSGCDDSWDTGCDDSWDSGFDDSWSCGGMDDF